MNMIKVLWCRFQPCLGTFTIFFVEAYYERGLFRHIYLTTFLESVLSKIQNLWQVSFFSKCLGLNLDFKNAAITDKMFNVSEKIASELVSLNCLD